MSGRKNIDPRHPPESWYPVLALRLRPGDPGWDAGSRCALEQADGERFEFRTIRQRDAFCQTHQLQPVDMATMAAIRSDFKFDLTQPWKPGNRLRRRPCVAITQRTVRRRRAGRVIRRRELRIKRPMFLPHVWRGLLEQPGLRADEQRIAPQWDPVTNADEPELHAIDPRPYRRDERTVRQVADDFMIVSCLTSDHDAYRLDFQVLQKRASTDPDFADAELMASTGHLSDWPDQVEIELGGIEVMIVPVRTCGMWPGPNA